MISTSDESVSEDSEYVPTDKEAHSESDETSDNSEESESSDSSGKEDDIRKRRIQSRRSMLQKSSPKCEVQNTPSRMTSRRSGRKTVA